MATYGGDAQSEMFEMLWNLVPYSLLPSQQVSVDPQSELEAGFNLASNPN
jgi:hypothetical protein